ncbi:MAG TPA: xanthine dehydrogenase family protein subunit M [Acidimicrobiia bacterium]|jgi:carbon-monoxide dehydrogenase medium subunit|nr:xanthine dehydrogenase family protein subunit M [Acidimicrobiia bacterium]
MKPARFEYSAPSSIDEALTILAERPGAKVLAGGQSLVPAMNFRLARPETLVDINRVDELDRVEVDGAVLRIGALARHRRFERPLAPGPLGQILPRVARHIGHLPIRTRGTFCGSLAHADPAAEWCLAAVVLEAEIVARSMRGERVLAADEFFDTVFTTALSPDELLVEARLPLLADDEFVGFEELSRRAGDFALVMAMAVLRIVDGRVAAARLGVGGAADRPLRLPKAEAALIGEPPQDGVFQRAAEIAATSVRPFEDIHASAEYRRRLVSVLLFRAMRQAAA